jgi:two-component system cell cycle response regulator
LKLNRVRLAVAGACLATGAPLGWFLLTLIFGGLTETYFLYTYLWLSTTTVFIVCGWQLGRLIEKIELIADSDRLTGLLNQTAFRNVTDKLHSYCVREGLDQSIVMLDIDHFKSVNDRADHLFGSYVIKEIGALLSSQCRQSDVLARFGGDEFIIYLPSTNANDAGILCKRIREAIHNREFKHGKFQVKVTLSFGIASTKVENLTDLIQKADAALYTSKANGRDRYTIFDSQDSKG